MEDCIKFSCNVPLSRVRWCVVVRLVPKRPRLVVYHSTPCSTSPPPFLPSSSSSFPFWQVTQADPVLSLSHQEAAAYNGKAHLSCQVVTRSAWDTLGRTLSLMRLGVTVTQMNHMLEDGGGEGGGGGGGGNFIHR